MERGTSIDYTMQSDFSRNSYILFEELIAIEKERGFLLREDFEKLFRYNKNDAQIVLRGFWKAGILYKIHEPGTFKFKISKYLFRRMGLNG